MSWNYQKTINILSLELQNLKIGSGLPHQKFQTPLSFFKMEKDILENFYDLSRGRPLVWAVVWLRAAPPRWPLAGLEISLAVGGGGLSCGRPCSVCFPVSEAPDTLPSYRSLGLTQGNWVFFFLSLFVISFSSFLFTLQVRGKGCKRSIWFSVFLIPSRVRPGFDTAFES